ncbi:PQQ-like beta-propeller repeat protein [Streptomyces cavernicola]|uniref:PQQ-binding-like beta-propeller repeat protein n=1 Tax=Streptomyces cavernicola TaxID=3043613 RepID=A0ABT6SHU6_9ACTN|nr:PQQ-like beta-propeller repeat protein [Streptomyces sp. B-S-A6]MDI3407550.1 PQQ-binding-like beta-propeller repeat protein [Streptomyces sp. B-S-A6]
MLETIGVDRRQALRYGAGAAGAVAALMAGSAVLKNATEEEKPPLRRPLWAFRPSGRDGDVLCLDPVLHANGTLYVRSAGPTGLYAVDAESGRTRWQARFDGAPGEPAATPHAVYAATDDAEVYALRASDGRRLWRVRPGSPLKNAVPGPVHTSGSVVLVSVRPHVEEDADPEPAELHALDAADGRVRWRTRGDVLAVRDGLAYVNPPDRSLTALDVRSGAVVWSAPVRDSLGRRTLDLQGPDALFGRNEVDEERTELVAYDPRTGNVRWTGPSTYHSVPVLGGDTLYVIGPGAHRASERRLHAFDAATGRRRWTRTEPARSLDHTIPLSADAHSVRLLLSADLGWDEERTTLRAYADDGRLLWETKRRTSSFSLVTPPDGQLVVGHLHDWYGYDSRTGRPSWRLNVGEDTASAAPIAVDGRLYCAHDSGVTAVRA